MIITLNVKVDGLIQAIKEIKSDNSVRLASLEAWKDGIDKYHAIMNRPHLFSQMEWIDSFRANYKLIVSLVAIIIGLIEGVIIALLNKAFHLI